MAFEVEQTSEVVRTASVHIPQETYEASVNKALRKLADRVKISGFRKGKIPLTVMRQRYGQAVQADVLDDLLNKSINEIVGELKTVLFVAQPQIQSLPMANDDFKFKVEIEVRPSIDPVGYKGMVVDKPAIEVSDDEIKRELEGIRRGYAKNSPIEGRDTVAKGDVVTFSFEAVSDDPELADFKGDNAQVRVGDGLAMKGIEEALEGAKFDAEVTASVTADDKFAIEELRGKSFDVKLKIERVEAQELPELDDQFAKDTGRAETLDGLKEVIRDMLAGRQEHEARHFAEDTLVETLLARHAFDLPPRYVEQELEQTVRQQLSQMGQMDEQQTKMMVQIMKESVRAEREKQIRTEFILLSIAEKEVINVDNDDLKKTIEHQASHMNVEPVRLMRFLNENKNALYQMMTTARLEKTLTWLLGQAEINPISWEEARSRAAKAEAEAQAAAAAAMPKVEDKPAKKAKAAKAEEAAEAAEVVEEAPKAKKSSKKEAAYDADAAREAFSAMTVGDLKDLCKNHDLKVGGKKEELVERLVEAQVAH